MAGELVPLVLIPRYSSFCGVGSFTTIAMEVTDYDGAKVNVWRGPLAGGGTFQVAFEESTDGTNFSTCSGATPGDPGQDTETQYSPTLNKRWFRIKVTTTGSNPHVTCWAMGYLVMRER